MTRNKKIGLAFLLIPWIGLIISFILYFISSWGISSFEKEHYRILDTTLLSTSTQSLTSTPLLDSVQRPTVEHYLPAPTPLWIYILYILRVVAGLLGILSFIFIFLGTGLGIYYMSKAEKQVDTKK